MEKDPLGAQGGELNLIALMPLRNEAYVCGLSIRVALQWCDQIVCLNHASTDATVDILSDLQREYSGRVHVISVPEKQWDEMQHRQFMLETARAKHASHIAIVDADEILTGNLVTNTVNARGLIYNLGAGAILQLPGYNLRCGLNRYHANGIWGRRWFSFAFQDDPRLSWAGDRLHHREPFGLALAKYNPIAQGQGGILHLWGARERRLKAKHALYKLTERLRWPDKSIAEIDQMYSWAIHGRPHDGPGDWHYTNTPNEWWAPYESFLKHLDLSAVPWQEAECKRLIDLHGLAMFSGFDLFGVV